MRRPFRGKGVFSSKVFGDSIWPKDFGESKHTLFREGSRTKFRDKPERHRKRSDACLDLCKKCLCARARYTAHAAAERLVFWVGSVQNIDNLSEQCGSSHELE